MAKTTHNNRGRKLLEKDIEKKAGERFKELGWTFEKFSSPSNNSVPDRMCSVPADPDFPQGLVFFIEFKRPYEKPTPAQTQDHERRRKRNIIVMVVDSYEETDMAISFMNEVILHPSTTVWEIPADLLS